MGDQSDDQLLKELEVRSAYPPALLWRQKEHMPCDKVTPKLETWPTC